MRQGFLLFILLLCLQMSALVCLAQVSACPPATADGGGDQQLNVSRLCLKLKFTKGRLDFDRTRSRFDPSDEFTRRLKPGVRPEDHLFKQLDAIFKELPTPYRLALSDEEKALDDKQPLRDATTEELRKFEGTWEDFIPVFNGWAGAGTNRKRFDEVFNESDATSSPGGAIALLTKAQETTASIEYKEYDPADGLVMFAVTHPINNWNDPQQVEIRLPGVAETTKREARLKRIREKLEKFSGEPRCRTCIENRLNDYYRQLGLTPNLIFDNQTTSPLIITVIEAARIASITWLSLEENDENIDKVLYSLLAHDDFRIFLKNRAQIKTQKQFNYEARTGHPGPYLNPTQVQIQQLLINQLGYTVSFTFVPNPAIPQISSYNLTIQKTSDVEEAAKKEETPTDTQNETIEAAPALANPEGVVTSHEQEKEAKTEFVPEKESKKKIKDKKRYLGGGFDYRPGQGVRFFGLGQLSRFLLLPDSVNSLSVKGGGQGDDGALGSINYFADYMFFNTLHRRLSLQLTVASDLDADRNLTGTLLDERRRSAVARLEFEPFRDWKGSLLRFFAEGRRATVALKQSLQPTAKQNLTTLDVGALYLFETREVEYPRRVRFEPKLRIGLGLAADEPRFNKLLAIGNFHQLLPRRFELDISGRLESASSRTPAFELPSFGGSEVVRGFRRDDALGRQLWSLQNELWIPLPVGDENSKGLAALLRNNFKLAPFADFGGLYKAVNTTSGPRSGLGLGLRMIYNPIVFKLDYAYGIGTAATAGSRGKFHFSISSNLPF